MAKIFDITMRALLFVATWSLLYGLYWLVTWLMPVSEGCSLNVLTTSISWLWGC